MIFINKNIHNMLVIVNESQYNKILNEEHPPQFYYCKKKKKKKKKEREERINTYQLSTTNIG